MQGPIRIGTALLLLIILSACRAPGSQAAEQDIGKAIQSVTEAGQAAGAAVRQAAEDIATQTGATGGPAEGVSEDTVTPGDRTGDTTPR